jgi:hypothetical protein
MAKAVGPLPAAVLPSQVGKPVARSTEKRETSLLPRFAPEVPAGAVHGAVGWSLPDGHGVPSMRDSAPFEALTV